MTVHGNQPDFLHELPGRGAQVQSSTAPVPGAGSLVLAGCFMIGFSKILKQKRAIRIGQEASSQPM